MYQMRNRAEETAPPQPEEHISPPSSSPTALWGAAFLTIISLPRLHELSRIFDYLQLGKLAIAVSVIAVFSAKVKNRVPWSSLPQVKIFIFLVFWMFVTAALGEWPGGSLPGVLNYLKSMLFFVLLVKGVYNTDDLYKLVWVLLLGMIVFDGALLLRAGLERADAGGYTLDANESALLIAMTMPFFYYFYRVNTGWKRFTLLFGMVAGAAATLQTESRGGVLSLCTVLVYAYFSDKGFVVKKVFLAALTVIVIFAVMPQGLQERFNRLGDESEDYNLTSKHGRMMVWKRAISMVKDDPVLGVGMNNFIFTESEVNNQSKGVVAHNFMLQAATELGLPGLGAFLFLFFVSWRGVRRLRRRLPFGERSPTFALLASVECAWVAFFLGGQFLSVAFSSQIVFLAGCSSIIMACHMRGDFNHYFDAR